MDFKTSILKLSNLFRKKKGKVNSRNLTNKLKGPTILYFYHIPKCGGTYTLRLLKKFQKEMEGDFISFNILRHEYKAADAEEKQIQFIDSLKNYSANKILLIHHHHGYPGIEDLHDHLLDAKKAVEARGGRMVLVTMLREPLSHLKSMVNYRNQKRDTDFETLINNPDFCDRMGFVA